VVEVLEVKKVRGPMDQSNAVLIAAAIGGLIGFFSAFYIDIARRQYELKKQVYLEALDTFTEAMKFWEKKRNEGLSTLNDDFYQAAFKFQSSIYKIKLCGCSKEVYDIMDEKLTDQDSFKDPKKVHEIIQNELLPAFIKDLKSWWQFWKYK